MSLLLLSPLQFPVSPISFTTWGWGRPFVSPLPFSPFAYCILRLHTPESNFPIDVIHFHDIDKPTTFSQQRRHLFFYFFFKKISMFQQQVQETSDFFGCPDFLQRKKNAKQMTIRGRKENGNIWQNCHKREGGEEKEPKEQVSNFAITSLLSPFSRMPSEWQKDRFCLFFSLFLSFPMGVIGGGLVGEKLCHLRRKQVPSSPLIFVWSVP